jgi:hypothetical protein
VDVFIIMPSSGFVLVVVVVLFMFAGQPTTGPWYFFSEEYQVYEDA